jgi:hypothetical protein
VGGRITFFKHLKPRLPKKSGPELLPRPDPYGARFTSDRAAISIYIATTKGDVKRRRIISAGRQGVGALDAGQCACQIAGNPY